MLLVKFTVNRTFVRGLATVASFMLLVLNTCQITGLAFIATYHNATSELFSATVIFSTKCCNCGLLFEPFDVYFKPVRDDFDAKFNHMLEVVTKIFEIFVLRH